MCLHVLTLILLTCAEQIHSLTRTKRSVTSVNKTLAVIASRSAAVFDQLKYQFVLRYKYVKHPFVFVQDANKSLRKFIHELGSGGRGGGCGDGFITHSLHLFEGHYFRKMPFLFPASRYFALFKWSVTSLDSSAVPVTPTCVWCHCPLLAAVSPIPLSPKNTLQTPPKTMRRDLADLVVISHPWPHSAQSHPLLVSVCAHQE